MSLGQVLGAICVASVMNLVVFVVELPFILFPVYQIQTKDGYLLALHRVSSSDPKLRAQLGPPVLLQHGLFMVIYLSLVFILQPF